MVHLFQLVKSGYFCLDFYYVRKLRQMIVKCLIFVRMFFINYNN